MNLPKKSVKFVVIAVIFLVFQAYMLNIYAKTKIKTDDKEIFIDANYILTYIDLYNGNIKDAQKTYEKILPYMNKPKFYKDYISILLYTMQYKKLDKFLQKAIKRFPNEKDFYSKLIDIYVIEGKFQKALEEIETYQKKFGESEEFNEKLALLYMKNENYEKAIKYLKKILNKDSDNPEIYNYLAKCYLNKGDFKKAIQYAKKSIRLDKYDMSYSVFLASIYEKQKRYYDAIKVYKKIKPQNSLVLSAIGNDYYLAGNRKKALKYFKEAFQKSGKLRYARKILYILMDNKEYKKAIEFIEKHKYSLLKSDDIKLIYGLALSETNNCKKAIEIFSNIDKNSKAYKEALYNKALCYKEIGKTDKAITILKKEALNNPDIYFMIADILIKDKKYKKALKIIKNNIKKFEDKSYPYFYMADIYYTYLKNRDKSIEYLKKALKINPKNASCLNYLGYLYIDENIDIDKGMTLVEKALKMKPNNPYYLDSLGWGYYKKGNYKKALEYLKKALDAKNSNAEYDDKDFVIELHLAKTYLKIGKKYKAKAILKSILKQSKDDKEAKELLKSIK